MRACQWCGASLEGRRPQARYHTGACRAAASRARQTHRASTDAPVETSSLADSTLTGVERAGCVTPADTHQNRTETAHGRPGNSSRYVGGPCSDELRCDYRHRFAAGPWTCAWNHPRYDSV